MTQANEDGPGAQALSDEQLEAVQGGQGISQQVKNKALTQPNIQSNSGKSIAQGDTIDNEDNLPG